MSGSYMASRGDTIFVGILVGIINGVGPIYNWGFLVADELFGLGCLILGYELWSHWDDPVQAVR